jgi:hypothetical protein
LGDGSGPKGQVRPQQQPSRGASRGHK